MGAGIPNLSYLSLPNYAGISFTNILQSVVAQAELAPANIESQINAEQNSISALGKLSGDLGGLQSALAAFQTMGQTPPLTAQVQNGAPFTANATSAATPGSYSVTVSSLAQSQVSVSQGYASPNTSVGTGTVTITVGSTSYSVTLSAANDTLSGLADAINASGAPLTATVLDTGSGSSPYVLELTAKATGTANAFSVTTSLSGGTAPSFTTTVAAQNAALTVNGVSFSSDSNTVTNAIPGATLNLTGTGGPYSVSINEDTQSEAQNLSSFVSAFNTLIADIQSLTQGQPGAQTPALYANGAVKAVATGLVQNLANVNLSQLGITIDGNVVVGNNGQLKFDQSAFNAAIAANPKSVHDAMSSLYSLLEPIVANATQPNTGVIAQETTSFQNEITSQKQQISSMQSTITQETIALENEYAQISAQIQQYTQLAAIFGAPLGSNSTGLGGSNGSKG